MALFIQNNATGAGAGTVLNPTQVFGDLVVIVNGDTGLGLDPPVGNRQRVIFTRTDTGFPATRADALVNTAFTPDYGRGAGPQAVPIGRS